MIPTLYRVIVPVSDIEKAESFYGKILGFPGERVSPGRHYFNCNGTILACYCPAADGDSNEARPLPDHIYIAVDQLNSTFAMAKDLECLHRDDEIRVQPWGERCFYAIDPFGNHLCFVDRLTVFFGNSR